MSLYRKFHPKKVIAACFLVFFPSLSSWAAEDNRPNILMIAVDDLNQYVNHLGYYPDSVSPNIDALAKKGLSFHRAYSTAAVCNATRTAMLTGLRSGTSGAYANGVDWRSVVAEE